MAAVGLAATSSALATYGQHPFVSLGGGHFGNYKWAVKARRPQGKAGAGFLGSQRPYLAVGVEEPPSADPFEEGMVFGGHSPFPRHLIANGPPLIITNLGFHGASVRMTAIAMAFSPAASRIKLTLCDYSQKTIRLRELNPIQAQKARLERFRYTAFAVRGNWCFRALASFNAQGKSLWTVEGSDAPGDTSSRSTVLAGAHVPEPHATQICDCSAHAKAVYIAKADCCGGVLTC
jgi:hypothetical protein